MAQDTPTHDHGFAHPTPVNLLVGVFIALVVLTVVTMLLAGNLGPFGFVVAMSIATLKGALVMGVFMHMIWEKPFNVMVFLGSTLFVFLFIFMTLTDTNHYQETIDEYPRAAETSSP